MNEPPLRPTIVAGICLGLLFAGLLIDLTTRQELVVAILFIVPIAFSGLALNRSLTIGVVFLALGANVTAAWENAQVIQAYDQNTLLNRTLAGLTFLLVGLMTLLVERGSDQVEELSEAEVEVKRQRALRDLLHELMEPSAPEDLIERAAHAVRRLMDADGVVITEVVDGRFTEVRWAAGRASSLALPGTTAGWAVDAIPVTDTPAITVRSERGRLTTGRWRRGGDTATDLIVLADRPRVDKPSVLLGESLRMLERMLPLYGGAQPEPGRRDEERGPAGGKPVEGGVTEASTSG